MYLNTHYIYIFNIDTNIFTEKYNGEIFEEGVVAKPWYFIVLAGSPPKKLIVISFFFSLYTGRAHAQTASFSRK